MTLLDAISKLGNGMSSHRNTESNNLINSDHSEGNSKYGGDNVSLFFRRRRVVVINNNPVMPRPL